MHSKAGPRFSTDSLAMLKKVHPAYESSYPLTASLGRFGTVFLVSSFQIQPACSSPPSLGRGNLRGNVVGIRSAGLQPNDFPMGGTPRTMTGPAKSALISISISIPLFLVCPIPHPVLTRGPPRPSRAGVPYPCPYPDLNTEDLLDYPSISLEQDGGRPEMVRTCETDD